MYTVILMAAMSAAPDTVACNSCCDPCGGRSGFLGLRNLFHRHKASKCRSSTAVWNPPCGCGSPGYAIEGAAPVAAGPIPFPGAPGYPGAAPGFPPPGYPGAAPGYPAQGFPAGAPGYPNAMPAAAGPFGAPGYPPQFAVGGQYPQPGYPVQQPDVAMNYPPQGYPQPGYAPQPTYTPAQVYAPPASGNAPPPSYAPPPTTQPAPSLGAPSIGTPYTPPTYTHPPLTPSMPNSTPQPSPAIPPASLAPSPTVTPALAMASVSMNGLSAPARLMFVVPAGAKLFVDGMEVPGTGPKRKFHTPDLPRGKTFFYEFRAEYEVNGTKQVEEKMVAVCAGDVLSESFQKLTLASAK